VGYQGRGTLGRDIQKYGPRNGCVFINNTQITINAKKPSHIKIVHGDEHAKKVLASRYREALGNKITIEIGK